MKKNKLNRSFALLGCVLMLSLGISCKKWLDVQPEDIFVKEQVYQTPAGVQELMNGFYQKLGNNNLYGSNLTLTTLDIMAQRYYLSAGHVLLNYKTLSFDQADVQSTFYTIWTNMYVTIANINDFLAILPTVDNGLTESQKNQYLGEAIGLRAFIHFDLLRLFGNYYEEATKNEAAIPYYTKISTNIAPISTSEEVIQSILNDIAKAETLLANDPIIAENSLTYYNNNRFNYYALKALKARVYLWIKDKPKAFETAKEVIAVQSKFPWVQHSNITIKGSDTDRKFFSENIFSLFNSNLYSVYANRFDENLPSTSILSTGSNNVVKNIYEDYEADYRYNYLWPSGTTTVPYRVFTKYADLTNKDNLSRYMVPIIRISEMYYIAAESAPTAAEGLDYLNTVRTHRNILIPLTDPSKLQQELTKEYQKEFYGEGQLWYYYKRNKMTSIFAVTENNQMTIALGKYKIQIPIEELNNR